MGRYGRPATPLLIEEGGPSEARAGWSLTNHVDSKATTPARHRLMLRPIGLALRATPPVSGGELLFPMPTFSEQEV